MRSRRSGAWLAALLLVVGGCGDAKSRVWEAQRASSDRWSQMAWGQPMEPATVEGERRRFECTWDALSRSGRDPREDFACRVRQLDSAVACMRPAPPRPRPAPAPTPDDARLPSCVARSRTVCDLSTDYQRAARACRGPTAP